MFYRHTTIIKAVFGMSFSLVRQAPPTVERSCYATWQKCQKGGRRKTKQCQNTEAPVTNKQTKKKCTHDMKRNVLRLWSRQFSLWDHKITQGYRVDNQQHNRETVWSTSHRTVILSDILFTLKAKTITGDNNLDAAFLGKSAEELNSVTWSNTSVLVFYKNTHNQYTTFFVFEKVRKQR